MTEIDLYSDYTEWDKLIHELSQKEIELINLKEQYNEKEQEIITTTNFKEIYGANNEKIRKTHTQKTLKPLTDKKHELEISINYIKRKIRFIDSIIKMKIELIKYGGNE